jgi:AcrR family transcriptional regulator
VRRSGRRPGDSGTRELILDAAIEEFAEFGYERATIRGIARRAGVDPALVHHYFTNKQQVFVAAMRLPFDPAAVVQEVLSVEPDEIGAALVGVLTRIWESEETRRPFIALLRSAVSQEQAAEMVRGFVTEALVGPIARRLGSSHARLRATLVGSQVMGFIMLRYIVKVEPLASVPLELVMPAIAPTIHRYLVEDLGFPAEDGSVTDGSVADRPDGPTVAAPATAGE